MENSDSPRRLDSKAYRLFRSECESHTGELDRLMADGAPELTSQESETGRIKCHTIKGGAGFFGLNELANCSARLEKLFAGWSQRANQAELKSGVEELKRLVGLLPKPKDASDGC